MGKDEYRSKRETAIAGMLRRYSLSFRYEYPLAVRDNGKTKVWHPDFFLPGQGVLVEYCGVNGNPDYDARREHKKSVYAEMGLPALFLMEDDLSGFWPARILRWMENVQADRLKRVRSARSGRI